MEPRLKNLEDQYRWSRETAKALRTGDLGSVDLDALINELESTAGGLERDLARCLEAALISKLRLKFTDANRDENRTALFDALDQIASLLWACPSLRDAITGEFINEAYKWARKVIMDDHNVVLPDQCPFSREAVMNEVETLEVE